MALYLISKEIKIERNDWSIVISIIIIFIEHLIRSKFRGGLGRNITTFRNLLKVVNSVESLRSDFYQTIKIFVAFISQVSVKHDIIFDFQRNQSRKERNLHEIIYYHKYIKYKQYVDFLQRSFYLIEISGNLLHVPLILFACYSQQRYAYTRRAHTPSPGLSSRSFINSPPLRECDYLARDYLQRDVPAGTR